jgi:mono/diheme cytochrome c family protein
MRSTLFFLCVGIAAATAGGSLIQNVPPRAAGRRNPFEGDEHALRAGAKLYARECASCHGSNREGLRHAPPLLQPEVQRAASGTLFWVLRNGSLHRGMPSFAHLPEAQRWQIVTFLKRSP